MNHKSNSSLHNTKEQRSTYCQNACTLWLYPLWSFKFVDTYKFRSIFGQKMKNFEGNFYNVEMK